MSCDRCEQSPELRRSWGCDEPTPYPFAVFEMRGKRYPLTRCPLKELRKEPRIGQVLTAYRWLVSYGIPPNEGGHGNQPAAFVAAVQVIEDERARIDRQR